MYLFYVFNYSWQLGSSKRLNTFSAAFFNIHGSPSQVSSAFYLQVSSKSSLKSPVLLDSVRTAFIQMVKLVKVWREFCASNFEMNVWMYEHMKRLSVWQRQSHFLCWISELYTTSTWAFTPVLGPPPCFTSWMNSSFFPSAIRLITEDIQSEERYSKLTAPLNS